MAPSQIPAVEGYSMYLINCNRCCKGVIINKKVTKQWLSVFGCPKANQHQTKNLLLLQKSINFYMFFSTLRSCNLHQFNTYHKFRSGDLNLKRWLNTVLVGKLNLRGSTLHYITASDLTLASTSFSKQSSGYQMSISELRQEMCVCVCVCICLAVVPHACMPHAWLHGCSLFLWQAWHSA